MLIAQQRFRQRLHGERMPHNLEQCVFTSTKKVRQEEISAGIYDRDLVQTDP